MHHEGVPHHLRAHVDEIVALATDFAAEHLDDEYGELGRRMTLVLARKRPSPLERGDARTWAAGIMHAVGWVNFLADPSQEPHLSTAELARWSGVGQSTIAARFRAIRAVLGLQRLDPTWTRPSRMLHNPLAWMILVDDVPVDARDAPRALQEEAFRRGLIPFVPGPAALGGSRDDDMVPDTGDAGDDGPDLRALIEAAVEGVLASDPDPAPGQFDAPLAEVMRHYNHRPQRELGGLAPTAVHRLVVADWERPDGAVRLDESLALDELDASHTLHNARLLLALLAERGEVRATTKGNLPRALVAEFRARMHMSPANRASRYMPESAAANEDDVFPLHIVRTLLQLAGLVKRRRGVFSRTQRGVRLHAPDRAGALLATLVRTHFRRLNLAYLDGIGPAPAFQHTIGYTLYRFGAVGGSWAAAPALVDAVVLPDVRAGLPDDRGFDVRALLLETRLLRPLEEFGLAESRPADRGAPPAIPDPIARWEYRASPLFDRLLHFDATMPE